ncbi:MAG: NfeD family protein [Rikenellaceae bacterium]|nr:NfeD family protein [Rikenellaceae bacterium]
MEWFSSMDSLEKVLWIIALTSSLVFIVQTVMTFMGMDGDGDPSGCDVGVSEDMPLELFTFRNFVNFFLGFSWTAIALYGRTGLVVTVVSGVIAGVLLVAAVMYMFYLMSRMEQSGNIDLQKSAVGCRGTVYIAIPEGGRGKVQITIQGAVREYDAVTDGESLVSGTPVKVVGVVDDSLLKVGRL